MRSQRVFERAIDRMLRMWESSEYVRMEYHRSDAVATPRQGYPTKGSIANYVIIGRETAMKGC